MQSGPDITAISLEATRKKKKYLYKRDKKFFSPLSFDSHIFNMEKLLQWAVNNSDNSALAEQAAAIRRGEAQPDPKRYDPKVLEAILGKDDATRMKGMLKTDTHDSVLMLMHRCCCMYQRPRGYN